MSTPTVNILPWAHELNTVVHENIVHIIKRLPKRSVLAMEIRPDELEEIANLVYNPSKIVGSFKRFGLRINPTVIMRWEILHACAKRGIKVVPLESPGLRKASSRAFWKARGLFTIPYMHSELNRMARRDGHSARIISRILSKHQSVFALIGTDHAPGLKDQLQQLGISSRVRVDLFGGTAKKSLNEYLPMQERLYVAWKNKLPDEELFRLNEITNRFAEPVKKSVRGRIALLTRTIFRRARTQHQRAQLKLRERKGEKGLRKRLSRRPKRK